jgi:phosphatidylserine synthase
LTGLACSVFAIYFSILGIYEVAMIGMIWAVLFDWLDGIVARKMTRRSATDSTFGGQLDILIDIISYGVAPSILLLSYGNFKPLFLIAVFIALSASALRLSYFSTFGLADGKRYIGLALDNNNIILVFIFLFEGFFSVEIFSMVLFISIVGLSILNVSRIETPKLSGNPINVYLLSTYTFAITSVYAWMLLN